MACDIGLRSLSIRNWNSIQFTAVETSCEGKHWMITVAPIITLKDEDLGFNRGLTSAQIQVKLPIKSKLMCRLCLFFFD